MYWWFAKEFGWTPEQVRSMSFAERSAIIAVNNAHIEHDKLNAEKNKNRPPKRRPRRRR